MSKSYISIKEKYGRIVVLVDMDAFYCQVEEGLNPDLKGKAIAVVQYVENAGIIAVNYKAKAMGVTRHMREKEAKAACPELICVKVPSKYNKADISKYKEAGKRVATVFEKFTKNLERASVDEAYLDITENVTERMIEMRQKKFALQPHHLASTFAVGYDNIGTFIKDVSKTIDQNTEHMDEEEKSLQSSKLRLLLGSSIVNDIRKAVLEETGYTCSAGIAHNKILAKLVCGMNKPNKQTLLPVESIPLFFKSLQIHKIKGMGGKVGEEVCRKLEARVMDDLLKYQESELQSHFGPRIGSFLYLIARGIDLEKVERKVMNKCIAVSKNFRGKNEIVNVNTLKFWLKELSKELKDRLNNDHEETNRVAKQMTVQFTQRIGDKDVSSSRTVQLNGSTVNSLSLDDVVQEAFNTIEKHTSKLLRIEGKCILNNSIKYLGIGAAKLEDANAVAPSTSIENMFKNQPQKPAKSSKRKKNEAIQDEIKVNELKAHAAEDEENGTLLCERSSKEKVFQEIDEHDLISSTKFHNDTAIKGERTLRHWLEENLRELNMKIKEKSSKGNGVPRKIKLLWRQLIGHDEKCFSEIIPIEVFANDIIKAEFLLNVIKDTTLDFTTKDDIMNPITLIELAAIDFDKESNCEWNFKIEEALSEEKEATGDTSVCEKTNFDNSMQYDNDDTEEIKMDCLQTNFDEDEDDEDISELEKQLLDPENEDDLHKGLEAKKNQTEKSEMTTVSVQKSESELKVEGDEHPERNDSKSSIRVKNENELMTAGPSYLQTYAEFKENPMFDMLNPLEECLECKKMVRKFDMLSHIDGHIAMQISIAQREEYRAEQKRKQQSMSIASQKSAKKTSKVKPTDLTTIDKFAKKIKLSQSIELSENQILCDECNDLIPQEDFISHKDHHYAQKLRMEQLKVSTKTTTGNTKRKTPNPSNSNYKVKSLKAYFAE